MDSLAVDQEYGISRAQLFHQEDHDESLIVELRKGPWTAEEDSLLFNYVSAHGDGRWNSLARHAGTYICNIYTQQYMYIFLLGSCMLITHIHIQV